jgi:hypothetical protein
MIRTEQHNFNETSMSGLSWASIFAGAAAAASLSLILVILGVGLGFSAISPWSNSGISAAALGITSIVWLTFTQIAASGMGGYLASRLRIRWATVHTDEVYFRDTAHGFLAWAIASLMIAALFGSAASNIVSRGVSTGTTLAAAGIGTAANAASSAILTSSSAGRGSVNETTLAYTVDSLLRSQQPVADVGSNSDNAFRLEAARIFAKGLRSNGLPEEDRQYLAQGIAKRTGLTLPDADKRVTEIFNKTDAEIVSAEQRAKELADEARKTGAYSALWLFVALLSGAFVASLSATFGGRQRDRVIHTVESSEIQTR